jgi:hypothetical protein
VFSLPASAASPTRSADGAQHLLLALGAPTIRAGAVRAEAIRCNRALVDCRVPWLGRRSPETGLGPKVVRAITAHHLGVVIDAAGLALEMGGLFGIDELVLLA